MNANSGVVTGVSVAHERATVDELTAARGPDQRTLVGGLLAIDGVDEAFAIQTCNRVEAYVVTSDASAGRAAVADFAPEVRDEVVQVLDHEESLRHLMRVAAGLESLVVGEDQILGQLRTAYEEARGAGGIGHILEDAVTKAIHVGERVRTETAINEGVVSLGSAAAEFASQELSIPASTAMVVGAGEMGTLAARALADRGVDRLLVANRTVPHAEHLVSEVDVDASALGLSGVRTAAAEADLVVAATASDEPVLDAPDLAAAGETTVVDLAQPRDVAPAAADCEDVTVYDLDALEAATEAAREQRLAAAQEAEAMIDAEFERLLEQYKRKQADEVIAAMYESAERVKARELDEAMRKLEADGLSDEQREVVEAMADSLVGQLLAPPTSSLRDAAAEDDWSTIQTALQLFDPEFGGDGPPAFVADAAPGGLPDEVPEDVPDDVAARVFEDD